MQAKDCTALAILLVADLRAAWLKLFVCLNAAFGFSGRRVCFQSWKGFIIVQSNSFTRSVLDTLLIKASPIHPKLLEKKKPRPWLRMLAMEG